MANDLSLLEGSVPSYARELDETTKSLMGHVSDSATKNAKRISIKGGVFRMVVGGKEVAQNDSRSMNVIIVAAAPYNSRVFYAKSFTEGQSGLMPDCSSDNGIVPNANSTNPQAKACKDCPQNIAGSGQNGSRACRFSRRLAVLLENDQKGDVYQLTLPAMSIFGKPEQGKMPLEAYVKLLGTNGVSVTSVVTEMKFDTGGTAPKLTFKAVRYLEANEFTNAQAKGKTPEAKQAIGSNPAELDAGTKLPPPVEAPVAEAEPEPVKRPAKKEAAEPPKDLNAVLDDWT